MKRLAKTTILFLMFSIIFINAKVFGYMAPSGLTGPKDVGKNVTVTDTYIDNMYCLDPFKEHTPTSNNGYTYKVIGYGDINTWSASWNSKLAYILAARFIQ